MKNEIMNLKELSLFLGYEDDTKRATKKWCDENQIPIMGFGKNKYIHTWTFDLALLRQMHFESQLLGLDADGIIDAIRRDDKLRLCEVMNIPLDESTKESFKRKNNEESLDSIMNRYKNKAV